MGFFELGLLCFVAIACICGSRGQNIAPSSPSFADSPHQQDDDVASSPADIIPPLTVLAPSLVPLPTVSSNPPLASPPAPILASSPVQSSPVQSSPVGSAPVGAGSKSPPVATPPVNKPIAPTVTGDPSKNAPPPQGSIFQASPPTINIPIVASPPIGDPNKNAPPPQGSIFQASPPINIPIVASPPIGDPGKNAPPPQGIIFQASPPTINTPIVVPPPIGPPNKNAPPPQGIIFQASPPTIHIPIITPPPIVLPANPPSEKNPTPSRAIAPVQRNVPANPPIEQPSIGKTPPSPKGHAISPVMTKPATKWTPPVASPPIETIGDNISPVQNSPIKGAAPAISPVSQKVPKKPSNSAKAPIGARAKPPSVANLHNSPLPSPKFRPIQQRTKKGFITPTISPSSPPPIITGDLVPPPAPKYIGHKNKNRHIAPPQVNKDPLAPSQSPISSIPSLISPSTNERTKKSHIISPVSLPAKPKEAPIQPILTLPPPPPNLDCNYLTCQEPLTEPPTNSPCSCVLPIKVALLLSKPLYEFFPLVSDFAIEISSGVKMQLKQVRVMGANVASGEVDKTVVMVNLVPVKGVFDNLTAFGTFERFWNNWVVLKDSLFGSYEVLYVTYPGLPPSPPSAQQNPNFDAPFGTSTNSRTIKPLGVDITNKKEIKQKNNSSIIAIVVLSSLVALIVITVIVWGFLLRRRDFNETNQRLLERGLLPNFGASSGTGHVLLAARHSSASGSICTTLSGQAKFFKLSELEISTNYFDQSRILGEGGFGCVYKGVLEDGSDIAVKVLRRHDGQGEREFLSEVEMLGRLHHRNLVRLIGICAEENVRCLVYELVPNGSVESHLHGQDKEAGPLDWNARMKIALGAARGLAYLHEDSSPCVIHRDFKSSNILLDHDFTPKVSDFGLAKSALGEGNQHISTRVMGTFGYVAPEYAMTGHLLVKSDVYSYGVVLLELLTGRKPVDMSRPSGQENLVTWARPILTNPNALREITDPGLGPDVGRDDVAKVAAIASMCVQPEVSHRPSMGEVVQALKLVCNESDEYKNYGTCSQELMVHARRATFNGSGIDAERVLLSEMLESPPVYNYNYSGDFDNGSGSSSFRRYNSSGPLFTGKNRQWQRLRSNMGSMSDHGGSFGFETRSDCSDRW